MKKHQPEILFEDDFLIALNKPAGLLVLPHRSKPEPNLKQILENKYGEIWMVHRLDRETSGVLLVAKDANTHRLLNIDFQNKQVEKTYWTLVNGKPNPPSATITLKIAESQSEKGTYITSPAGAEAVTHYQTIKNYRLFSLLSIQLETGKTHQIRVHMKVIGHPLAVDPIYGKEPHEGIFLSQLKRNFKFSQTDERPIINRLTLHAKQIQFVHPITKEEMKIEAPLPKDFSVLLKLLEEHNC